MKLISVSFHKLLTTYRRGPSDGLTRTAVWIAQRCNAAVVAKPAFACQSPVRSRQKFAMGAGRGRARERLALMMAVSGGALAAAFRV